MLSLFLSLIVYYIFIMHITDRGKNTTAFLMYIYISRALYIYIFIYIYIYTLECMIKYICDNRLID